MRILGIETSCDETGVAIYDSDRGLLSHVLESQAKIHTQYGGVVPELASRDHIRKVLPLIEHVLKESNSLKKDLTAIAYTAGPGLIGALLVGATIAAGLAYALKIPLVPVHHLKAHLLAAFLEEKKPQFPFLALLVSGGHTQLIEVKKFDDYKILGESLDDACGEAFDKTAKILGLPYPGGPLLEKLAKSGSSSRFHFPRPMLNQKNLNFSFSGLKTFALTTFENSSKDLSTKADVAKAFQDAIIETLIEKTKKACQKTKLKQLVVAGGVSANQALRKSFIKLSLAEKIEVFFPKFEFSTDNGAMIAYCGYQNFIHQQIKTDYQIEVFPRWEMGK